jgi:uncharacterized membrane protein
MFIRLVNWFKNRLLTGVVVMTPLALTVWLFYTLFIKLDGLLAVIVERLVGRNIPGSGLVALILITLLIGVFARNFFGGKLISLGNMILERIPLVSKIYGAIRQITEVFFGERKTLFEQVVIFEYPRKGSYVLGFVTSRESGEVSGRLEKKLVNIFLPTTPNPTSGFLLFVPEKDVIFLDMSVEDGIKMVISGGAVVPEYTGQLGSKGADIDKG